MNKRNFLIAIFLFFLKIFTTKCESRKIQLIVVVNNKVYRYYTKYIDTSKGYRLWGEKFDTDFTVNDNKIDLKNLEQKIKNNELELVGKNKFSDDINNPIKSNLKNYIITRYYIFTDNERKIHYWKIYDDLESSDNRVFDIPSYNINKEADYYIEIPKDINHIFVFLEDKKNLELIKKGDIKHISFKYDGKHLSKKEDYIELSENIKLSDYFTKDKNLKISKYSKNNQICNFINDKILKNEKFKNNVVKLKDITKAGNEEFKFEDIVNKGGFIDEDFYLNDKDLNCIDYSDNDKKNIEQKDMYLDCKLKFRKNVDIIFNIPKGTKLDQCLKMKQKALLELDSFNQKVIEKTLLETILKISINKKKVDGSENLHLSHFWKGYEGLWVEKYEIIDKNGNIISTVIGPNDNNYIDFSDKDNIVFKIYLTPGSEILEGIFVHLHFIAPDGKFVSSQLLKSPKNESISNNQVVFLNNVFLDDDDRVNNNDINHQKENYLKQLKKILKEGYFNKQKISLDEDCYKFVKEKSNSAKKKYEYIDIDLDFSCDPYDVQILFTDKAINKYIKNNEADEDPIYYGNGDQRTTDNKPFDDNYEYNYKYDYQPVTGDFDNYYVDKTYKIKSFKNGSVNSSDYIDYEISDYTETQNEYKETKTPQIDKNLGYCAKCMSKCCCCCKRNV